MVRLLKAELFKLTRLRALWLLLVVSSVMGGLRGTTAVLRDSALTEYEVYLMELMPDLFYSALICVFASVFVCGEFSNRTFGSSFLSGCARRDVFLAKATIFFVGMLPMILFPVMTSTIIASIGNGFGREWSRAVAFDAAAGLLCYLFRYFFLGGFVLLAAALVRDRIGTFGAGMFGAYVILFMAGNLMERQVSLGLFLMVSLLETAVMSTVATLIFAKRDLR